MSYQVLARKWRPKTFREMVGQEHVLKALINALDHSRLHHAYLFTGTRGVGKTTIARILAKCLNCEVGVSSEPCGACSACLEIAEGRFIDLIEVDAASRTKVEDTRDLLENVQYAPTRGRFKVYLIDEVHMLSTHSFNALLKTLEEPPPHVKFLLATTDPQKLPATILSRCLQFNLKNMTPERIVRHLSHVLEQEMVGFEEAGLWLLGRSADGSMRDALSLTDQAIAFGSGKVLEADVRAMLGTIDQGVVYELLDALAAADGAALLAAVARVAEHATDFGGVLEELLAVLHRVAIAQAVPDALDNSRGDRARILELAAGLTAEDVQLFYQIGLNGRRDLPQAPDPRGGLEMTLLRMLAFRPQGVPQPPRQALRPTGAAATGSGAAAAAPQPAPGAQAAPVQPIAGDSVPKKSEAPAAAPVVVDTGPSVPPPVSARVVSEPAADAAPVRPVEAVVAEDSAEYGEYADIGYMDAGYAEYAASAAPAPARAALEAASAPETRVAQAQIAVAPVSTAPERPATSGRARAALEAVSAPEISVAQAVPAPVSAAPERPVTPVRTGPAAAPLTLAGFDNEVWVSRFPEFGIGGVLGTIAAHCALGRAGSGRLHFVLDRRHASFFDPNHTQRVQEQLARVLGESVAVTIEVGEPALETPAVRRERNRQLRLAQARQAIAADPNVRLLQDSFGALLDEASIEPVDAADHDSTDTAETNAGGGA